MVILGGGYIAAEFAHVFSAPGRARHAGRPRHPAAAPARLRDHATASPRSPAARWDVRLGTERGRRDRRRPRRPPGPRRRQHRRRRPPAGRHRPGPNTADLGLAAAGVETHGDGRVAVDCYGRTNVEGVWALGDVSSPYQLKHVANHEARVVAHNLAHPDEPARGRPPARPARRCSPTRRSPASGCTEDEVRAQRVALRRAPRRPTATRRTAGRWRTPPASASWSPTRATGLLLGAHLIGSAGLQPDPAADPGDVASGRPSATWPGASTGSTPRWPRSSRTPCSSWSWPRSRT